MVCNHHSFIHLFRSQSPRGIPNIQRFNHSIFKSLSPTNTTLIILISYLTSLNHSSSTKNSKKPGLESNKTWVKWWSHLAVPTKNTSHLSIFPSHPGLGPCCLGWLRMLCGDDHRMDLLWLHRAILFSHVPRAKRQNGRIISWSPKKTWNFWWIYRFLIGGKRSMIIFISDKQDLNFMLTIIAIRGAILVPTPELLRAS